MDNALDSMAPLAAFVLASCAGLGDHLLHGRQIGRVAVGVWIVRGCSGMTAALLLADHVDSAWVRVGVAGLIGLGTVSLPELARRGVLGLVDLRRPRGGPPLAPPDGPA